MIFNYCTIDNSAKVLFQIQNTIWFIQLLHSENYYCKYYGKGIKEVKEYIELLGTYSDHIAIDEVIRTEFFAKIEETINEYGGFLTLYDTIDLQLARKPY